MHNYPLELSSTVIIDLPPTLALLFSDFIKRVDFQFLISFELPSNYDINLPESTSQDRVELVLDIVLRSE